MTRWRISLAAAPLLAFCSLGAHCSPPGLRSSADDDRLRDAAAVVSTDEQVTLRVYRSRPDVEVNCDLLPTVSYRQAGLRFPRALFEPAVETELQPGAAIPLELPPGRKCALVRVEDADGEGAVVMLREQVPIKIEASEEGLVVSGGSNAWHDAARAAADKLPLCPPSAPAMTWSEPVPVGRNLYVAAVNRSQHCTELLLHGPASEDEGAPFRWKLCGAQDTSTLPFAKGERIDITAPDEAGDMVVLSRRGPTGEVALTLRVSRAELHPERQLQSMPGLYTSIAQSCRLPVDDACASVWVPLRLRLNAERRSAELGPGEQLRWRGVPVGTSAEDRNNKRDLAVQVQRARLRVVHDKSCDPESRSTDLIFATTELWPAGQGANERTPTVAIAH